MNMTVMCFEPGPMDAKLKEVLVSLTTDVYDGLPSYLRLKVGDGRALSVKIGPQLVSDLKALAAACDMGMV